MHTNFKSENKDVKKLNLNLEEKNNKNFAKPLIYSGLTIAAASAFALLAKNIYDKSNKINKNNLDIKDISLQENNQIQSNNNNNNNNSRKINKLKNFVSSHGVKDVKIGNVTLAPAYQNWIRKNAILIEQQYPLCWHNASLQFLACPEFRFSKEYDKYPDKIKIMINWINSEVEKQYNNKNLKIKDYFKRNIIKKFPMNIRQVPDNSNWLNAPNGGMFMFYTSLLNDYTNFNRNDFTKQIVNLNTNSDFIDNNFIINYNAIDKKIRNIINNKNGFTLAFCKNDIIDSKINLTDAIFYPNKDEFYPTFIAMNTSWEHYNVFYIIYNEDKTINCVLFGDGGSAVGFEMLTYEEFLEKIQKETYNLNNKQLNGSLFIRYSPKRIVDKYYTPELMYAKIDNLN